MENERLLLKIEELMKQRGYSRYRLSHMIGNSSTRRKPY